MKSGAKSKVKSRGPRERDPEEERFLEKYRPGDWPRPSVTVDLVILTVQDHDLRVLLVKRSEHPFKDRWALPGGFVRVSDDRNDQGEDLDAAALRELGEETGLARFPGHLEQLRTYGDPDRDPRADLLLPGVDGAGLVHSKAALTSFAPGPQSMGYIRIIP